jgi:hypothetical protein
MVVFRLVLVAAIFIAANALTLAAPSTLAAVRVGGEAYGLAVGSPAVGVPGAAYVQLPAGGGNVTDTSPGAGYGLGNAAGSTSKITTNSDGDLGAGNVTSVATVLDGELLGGVVRVHDVRATASVANGRPSGGVVFGSVIVAGIGYPNPLPNTRIEVPNVGIVIINEQLTGSDGGNAAMVVRAVRLQITEPSLFDLPRGTELILAHAAAGVPDVVATNMVRQSAATATTVPWAPISAYRPVDVSLDNGDDGNDNDFEFDNGNDNGGSSSGGITPVTSPTSAGIVITVIVVPATNTPTVTLVPGAATATATRTPGGAATGR